ncbi:MAG: FGGY-family carbohydrate kinase [Eubacteriales bacterium]|nr:FGGY-family carbohydrate kinase [Eubacteriales bacterium]
MDKRQIAQEIHDGKCVMGLEFGSTRIKAVLIDQTHAPIASGAHDWENRLENGVWTYHMEDVWEGLRDAYAQLKKDVQAKYDVRLTTMESMGFSAMMHGYLPFDQDGKQLAEFRTWRNTMTEKASAELTERFGFNVPQRWSIAHLYQAMLNKEPHVKDIAFLTTLEGYVHWKLTGQKVLGIGEGAGMFPVDSDSLNYDGAMLQVFDSLTEKMGYSWRLQNILPKVLNAGDDAGALTEEGARLLDPDGDLLPGIPLCPPEGDAGTGMVATNSVGERTGNVSAGTSVFAMIVLEKALSKVYPEIDMVCTPTGKPVAMVHCNNCTSDINAWANVFKGFADAIGSDVDMGTLYTTLFNAAMKGEPDCGGVLNYAYLSGEPITAMEEGRPMIVRTPDSRLTFPNFARSLINGAIVTLKIGMDILVVQEHVRIDRLLGHGGFFKTKGVGQKLLAAALGTPISVMETAGEGGPWGMALLAAYRAHREAGETLESYLQNKVFSGSNATQAEPDEKDAAGFTSYEKRFTAGLEIERAAVKAITVE